MSGRRLLIVNADDFGQSAGVNEGVRQAQERGIVTSASLMVRWPAAAAAAAYAHAHPALSVGLHLDLGEWTCRDGEWVCAYEVIATEDGAAVQAEVERQLTTFRKLMGRDPSHLDSHQHVHRQQPVRSVLVALARRLRVPLRDCTPGVRYCGGFYGQAAAGEPFPEGIEVGPLIEILGALPAGVTELGCHPGLSGDVDSMYRHERTIEVQTLCDGRVRQAIADLGIALGSFRDPGVAGRVP
jgi:predicted glycoside hydrolase/deacetylase ChbG (UPF0249 family)